MKLMEDEVCNAYGGGGCRDAYRDLVGEPKERDHVEGIGEDGRIKTSIMTCRRQIYFYALPFTLFKPSKLRTKLGDNYYFPHYFIIIQSFDT
jgi:hypothetical protein